MLHKTPTLTREARRPRRRSAATVSSLRELCRRDWRARFAAQVLAAVLLTGVGQTVPLVRNALTGTPETPPSASTVPAHSAASPTVPADRGSWVVTLAGAGVGRSVPSPTPHAGLAGVFRPDVTTGTVDSTDRATICARPVGEPSTGPDDATRMSVLSAYGLTPSRVRAWAVLVPAWLGGDTSPTVAGNWWPVTDPSDLPGVRELDGWLRTYYCTGAPVAGAPATVHRVQSIAREPGDWFGVVNAPAPGADAGPERGVTR